MRTRLGFGLGLAISGMIATNTIALAAGSWVVKAPVPTATGIEGMQGAQINGKIYAAYGFEAFVGDTNHLRVYSIATDTWSVGPDGPLPVHSEGASVAKGDKLIALGGRAATGMLANMYVFDTGANAWSHLPSMPTARAGLGAAVPANGKLYALGGRTTAAPCNGGELATVEIYNFETKKWTTGIPLPGPRSDVAAVGLGSKIYVFGGCVATVPVNDLWIFDTHTNTWSLGSPMPTAHAAIYQVASLGSNIHVIGGANGFFSTSGAHEVYNASTGTWSTSASMLTPRGEMIVVRGRIRGTSRDGIYAVGGAMPCCGLSSSANELFIP